MAAWELSSAERWAFDRGRWRYTGTEFPASVTEGVLRATAAGGVLEWVGGELDHSREDKVWSGGPWSGAEPRPHVNRRPDPMSAGLRRLRAPCRGTCAAVVDPAERVHILGPKWQDDANRPRPIIACLLRHKQACKLLQAARAHSLFRSDGLEVRLTADFSKETSERRRAFLAFRPRLLQLEVKYGLFEPARMWITKNGVSKDFYDPEDLQVFLEGLQNQTQSMDTAPQIRTQDLSGRPRVAPIRIPPLEKWDRPPQTPIPGEET
ncbi:hypothetical protein NDU88_001871 [Pleurodeles waltl]|uniref:Uncharacterized protein n=1 Tax=Pleurodeles waltl TaxID=8319 RepID=A0AAV7VB96_PLEWA|nr:hypothetical protein NDU88_001871 [Pleurodeles waltl]